MKIKELKKSSEELNKYYDCARDFMVSHNLFDPYINGGGMVFETSDKVIVTIIVPNFICRLFGGNITNHNYHEVYSIDVSDNNGNVTATDIHPIKTDRLGIVDKDFYDLFMSSMCR